jgi:hypothetical protein
MQQWNQIGLIVLIITMRFKLSPFSGLSMNGKGAQTC